MQHLNTTEVVMQKIRIGVSPLSWVNEFLPDLGVETTASALVSEAKAAGYQGVEMSRALPSDPAELTSLMAKHDMTLASGWYNGFLAECSVEEALADVRAHAGLLRACGAHVMVYGECGHMIENALDRPLTDRMALADSDLGSYGARLTAFAEALRDDFGMQLAYHPHLMTVTETLDEIRTVMAHTGPDVGLLLDTGHAAAAGFDYGQLITEFAPRICHIHLKDLRADIMAEVRANDISFNEGVRRGMFTVPGDGSVSFDAVAEFIGSGAYTGWLVIEAEQDPIHESPADTVSRAFQFVQRAILGHPASEQGARP